MKDVGIMCNEIVTIRKLFKNCDIIKIYQKNILCDAQ